MLFLGGRHNSISYIGMVSLMQFPSKLKAVLELEIQRCILSSRAPWNMIHITILVLFFIGRSDLQKNILLCHISDVLRVSPRSLIHQRRQDY